MLRPMRRPLGGGMPLQMIDDGNPVNANITLFDTNTLDQNQVWQVTVKMWPAYAGGALTALSFAIDLVTNGVAVKIVQPTVAGLAAIDASIAAGVVPTVIDRLTLRGNQQLILRPTGGEGPTGGSWAAFGYFEMNGSDPLPYDFRPLEPTALVSPFNAAPTVLDIAAAALTPVYAAAHLLNAQYVDLVTLIASVQGVTAPFDSALEPVLRFPTGLELPLLPIAPTALSGTVVSITRILEGIPLLAPSSTNNALQIGFLTPDGTGAVRATSYGSFTRIS